jgi:outer membrane protein assembly factor BamB
VRATATAAGPATAPPAPEKPAESTPAPAVARTAPRPWPAFRGENAGGTADGQGAVTEWDIEKGSNVRWKTPIPGFSNASPIVWGNKVFVVSAISSAGDSTFRTGLYGDVKPVDDLSEHTWKVYCLDKGSGKILWEQTAFKGLPKVKRHTKASQANSTPVTDGNRVVALFGSIGRLMAWDMNGKALWNVDVGVLDSGWFFDPTYQWGFSSSPIIHKDKVIVQADIQKNSFIAAYDVKTGKRVWKTDRDEIPSWGSPTIFDGRIVTNGPIVRAYDAETGAEVWKLGPNSEVTVGTPVVGDGLVFVTGGYPPARPIYAVKSSARGDISMPKDKTSSDAVAWSNSAGTYIPTPLHYRGILYTCDNGGVVTAYEAETGERIYRARVGGGGSFAASPIAADGKLYFANEDGDIIVARAGRKYEEIAKNQMKEVIMSTPAIADGLIVVRTFGHVYGIGAESK